MKPTYFKEILTAVKESAKWRKNTPREQLAHADLIVADLQPPGRCLCACNRAWLQVVEGHPISEDGHGWNDCEVRS